MKSSVRGQFAAPVVPMNPGEDLDRYKWRRRDEQLKAKAAWLRTGGMGMALDADGNPLYRINDRAHWARTKPLHKSRHRETLERDGHRCVQCGSTQRLEVDHVVRYIDGGSNELGNLRTLCAPCHSKRGGHA